MRSDILYEVLTHSDRDLSTNTEKQFKKKKEKKQCQKPQEGQSC